MAGVSFTWTLIFKGWAACAIADEQAAVQVHASRVRAGPGDLLTALARLVLGATDDWAEFEDEPTTFRWIFHRTGGNVDIQILELPDFRRPDRDGRQIWTSRQPLNALVRAVIRAFDDVAWQYGDDGYDVIWGAPFPHAELEALRAAWQRWRRRDSPAGHTA